MKTNENKTFQKLNLKEYFNDEVLNMDELLKVEGGEDADMDNCDSRQCESAAVKICYNNA